MDLPANAYDRVADAALMIRGIKTGREAETRWPYVLARLESVARLFRRLPPGHRPRIGHALAWLDESAAKAPLDDERRAEVLAVIAELRELVAAPAPARSHPRGAEAPARPGA